MKLLIRLSTVSLCFADNNQDLIDVAKFQNYISYAGTDSCISIKRPSVKRIGWNKEILVGGPCAKREGDVSPSDPADVRRRTERRETSFSYASNK